MSEEAETVEETDPETIENESVSENEEGEPSLDEDSEGSEDS